MKFAEQHPVGRNKFRDERYALDDNINASDLVICELLKNAMNSN